MSKTSLTKKSVATPREVEAVAVKLGNLDHKARRMTPVPTRDQQIDTILRQVKKELAPLKSAHAALKEAAEKFENLQPTESSDDVELSKLLYVIDWNISHFIDEVDTRLVERTAEAVYEKEWAARKRGAK